MIARRESPTELAWAAGVLESIGCISISESQGSYRVVLSVAISDHELVYRLKMIFGGYINLHSKGKETEVWRTGDGAEVSDVLDRVKSHCTSFRFQERAAMAQRVIALVRDKPPRWLWRIRRMIAKPANDKPEIIPKSG